MKKVLPRHLPDGTTAVKRSRLAPGFALIVTITILVLLALVAVGLLTLSTITVRSSNLSSAQAEARANARLALMLAIGELQKQAGSDQRITATAGILDDSPDSSEIDGVPHAHWTGVWNPWAAGREAFGNDRPSQHRSVGRPGRLTGTAPSYDDHREDHFRSWLVSLPKDDASSLEAARSEPTSETATPDPTSPAIRLVGDGTLRDTGSSDEGDYVSAPLLDVDTDGRSSTTRNGRYAWWVADESTKARILRDSFESGESMSNADYLSRAQSPGSTGYQAIGALSALDDPGMLDRAFSRASLELAADGDRAVHRAFHDATPFSHGVLADVREGGLKRDLNALLERPIRIDETRDEWMLYRLGRDADRVPLQDLAAYYQTYRDVVTYSGRKSGNPKASRSLQVNNIDFGDGYGFKREYTHLYRFPVPIKLQYVLSYVGVPRDQSKITRENPDPYKLHVGITPAVTLWNPYNVPLVLNHGDTRSTEIRYFNLPFGIRWTKKGTSGTYESQEATSLSWITNRDRHTWNRNNDRFTGFEIFYGGRNPIVFEPGEVRVFSLRKTSKFGNSGANMINTTTVYREVREVDPGWDPNFFLEMPRSDRNNHQRHVERELKTGNANDPGNGGALTFKASDSISFTVGAAEHVQLANGCAFQFFCRQSSVVQSDDGPVDDNKWLRRLYTFISRHHRKKDQQAGQDFSIELMRKGFPEGKDELRFDPIRGSELVNGNHRPFLLVSLTMGSEVSTSAAGDARGRRHVQRPFLHSPGVQALAFVDRSDDDSFYFQPWNWWVQDINSVLEASVQVDSNNLNSFFGGGYTPEFGTTHCVQMEVPLAPLHSIGALSHAKLGGYSIANNQLAPGWSREGLEYASVTATGANGLFPNMCQAIGNSYAHPYLKPDKASSTWSRHFSAHTGLEDVPMADHSYLANKALWDDYFFSSIAPQRTDLYDRTERRGAKQLAEAVFFDDESLPNRRLVPYTRNLSEERLDDYFDGGETNLRGADELAAHLMVEGPFNVNSTSVEAWKALFSSLRNKAVGSLELADSFARKFELTSNLTEGTPVGSTLMPNGRPVQGSSSNPADPDQWYCWRELSDEEIEELAVAIVDQVKQRGPFLSLSDFVNRRLDRSDTDLAVKGALQSALDDPDVSINAGFRSPDRVFSPEELGRMNPKFPAALAGPVAYGSTAYIDQADILRHLGAQLTTRGDTFLIRTYGDSLDPGGTIRARAWCEAVVQRVPEYIDPSEDPAHTRQDDLDSDANKVFGRPFRVVSFRWLDADEV